MCFVDCDPPSVHRQEVVKTRKPHKCYECQTEIPVGKKALFVFSVYDGETYSHYTCGRCEALRRKIHDMEIRHGCKEHESWCPYGGIHEYISNYYDNEYDWSVADEDIENALRLLC